MLIAPEQSTEAKSSTKRRTGEKKRTKKNQFCAAQRNGFFLLSYDLLRESH